MDKNEERFYIDRFFESFQLKPEKILNTERPDFIASFDNENIGIEIVTLRQKNRSSIAGNKLKIANLARDIAIKNNMPPVDVHIWLSDNKKSNTQEYIKNTAKQIYKLVDDNLEKIISNNGHSTQLARYLDNISKMYARWNVIDGKKWLDDHRWSIEHVGFVSTDFIDVIKEEVEKKNRKLNEYKKKCEQCWLILVIDRMKQDGHLDYSYMEKGNIYNSLFDKTFIFDYFEKIIYSVI